MWTGRGGAAWRVGLGCCVLLVAGRAGAHNPSLLDPSRPNHDIKLALVEVERADPKSPRYRLVAEGVPRGVTFNLWTREFADGYHELESGFRVDDTGKLAARSGEGVRYLDQIVFEPGPYFRGALWEIFLATEDRRIAASARVIPLPMVARDGRCALTLELVSHRGQRFLATTTGFVPGADALVELTYGGRVHQTRRRVTADGQLPPDLVSLASVTPGDYRARYSVTAGTCGVALEYGWGKAAFERY